MFLGAPRAPGRWAVAERRRRCRIASPERCFSLLAPPDCSTAAVEPAPKPRIPGPYLARLERGSPRRGRSGVLGRPKLQTPPSKYGTLDAHCLATTNGEGHDVVPHHSP